MSHSRNTAVGITSFGNRGLMSEDGRGTLKKEQDDHEQLVAINQTLIKQGLRPADALPSFEECPQCGSRQIHTTVNRVRCQNCGKILDQRKLAPPTEKVDGVPT